MSLQFFLSFHFCVICLAYLLFRFHFECRECSPPLYPCLKINANVGQFREGQSSWENHRRGGLSGTDLIRMPSAGPVSVGWMFLHGTNLCPSLVFMTYVPGRLWAGTSKYLCICLWAVLLTGSQWLCFELSEWLNSLNYWKLWKLCGSLKLIVGKININLIV